MAAFCGVIVFVGVTNLAARVLLQFQWFGIIIDVRQFNTVRRSQ